MRTILVAAAAVAALAGGAGQAEARGCIKGAIVGGVAGHLAGRHGVIGAAAGCLGGRALANRRAARREADYGRRGGGRYAY